MSAFAIIVSMVRTKRAEKLYMLSSVFAYLMARGRGDLYDMRKNLSMHDVCHKRIARIADEKSEKEVQVLVCHCTKQKFSKIARIFLHERVHHQISCCRMMFKWLWNKRLKQLNGWKRILRYRIRHQTFISIILAYDYFLISSRFVWLELK